ncbi:MAG: L-threonylcarbamoyladenylate synthase [Candidatus Omnitrophota bacterium]
MKTNVITERFQIKPNDPDLEKIGRCAELIRRGGLVAFPTETVYGLAACASNEKAIARIYEVKKRPSSKPLTLHISDELMIGQSCCEITPQARKLIDAFWPGPMTIILRKLDGTKVGFRMPKNKAALLLIERVGCPVVAPSANASGTRAPADAAMVLEDLDGKIDAVLDAGPTEIGRESTVIDSTVSPPVILRHGAIKEAAIRKVLGYHGSE